MCQRVGNNLLPIDLLAQIDPCDLTWYFPLVGSAAWRLLESFMSDSYLTPPPQEGEWNEKKKRRAWIVSEREQ